MTPKLKRMRGRPRNPAELRWTDSDMEHAYAQGMKAAQHINELPTPRVRFFTLLTRLAAVKNQHET